MKTDSREPQAPESYATFWGPVPVDAPAIPQTAKPSADAKDAYPESANVAEDVPVAPRAERV